MTRSLLLLSLLVSISGCAWLAPVPVETMAKLPVVRVGEKPPQGDHVVFFPAGVPVPVKLSTSGSMFQAATQVESQVILAKDLYLYKYWASRDGKAWRPSHALMSVEFGGGFDLQGLNADIKVDGP